MPTLTIATANVDSPEWAELFIKSIRKYTRVEYEIVIIDNGSLPGNLEWLEKQKDIRLVKLPTNIGHGSAMDLGTQVAQSRYVAFLDVDAHIQRANWDKDLLTLYRSNDKIKLIGVVGPEHKPLHPPLFFYEREFILENNISFKYLPRLSTDTAQKAYWDIVNMGFQVERLKKGRNVYPGCIGDEIAINNQSTIFHAWYGTRFCENNPQRTKDKLDGYTLVEHLKEKERIFNQPQVKEILAHKELFT
jgi:GT2 family glycosyltransferase